MKFTYTRLLVVHFAECFRFYRGVMGFQATYGNENDRYADFDTGTTTLALFKRDLMAQAVGMADQPAHADCQDRVALIFAVDNVDGTFQRLQAHGVTFVTPPTDRPDWGIRSAHFRDPDGNLIEVNAALAA